MRYPPNNLAVLRAIGAGRVGWVTACGEWIDNSFDRAATHVAIVFERGALVVEDNGEGTPAPDKIVTLGEHTIAAQGLGEFGMGGKESLLWAGGERSDVRIESTYHGVRRSLSMNWFQYARTDWELPPIQERTATPGDIGTRILVRPLQARIPTAMDRLCDELGYLYSHAIRRENRQITIKPAGIKARPRLIVPWEPPPFDEALPQVRSAIVRVGQREAVVSAGVVKEGIRNERWGLTYFHRYRVILPASARGCGRYNPHRLCGFVELLEGWKPVLTRNKNGITVDDEALFDEVARVLEPVLQAAERAGSTFALRELTNKLEDRAAAMLKNSKARRKPGDEQGTVTPKGSERKHNRADKEQPGASFAGSKHANALKVGYGPLGNTKIGEAKPPNILLNTDNPFIAQAVIAHDEMTLILAIGSLIADWECHHDGAGNRYLKGIEPKNLPELLGIMMAHAPTLDGKPALKAVG